MTKDAKLNIKFQLHIHVLYQDATDHINNIIGSHSFPYPDTGISNNHRYKDYALSGKSFDLSILYFVVNRYNRCRTVQPTHVDLDV